MGDLGVGESRARAVIVCGLAVEAATLGTLRTHPDIDVLISGANAARAAQLARSAAAKPGVALLVSWGISGGLDPKLRSGDLVVAEALAPHTGTTAVFGSDRIVGHPAMKREIFERTGASAVDMESDGVSDAATSLAIPWVAIRAISDPAERLLPPALEDVVGDDGHPRLATILMRLARSPWIVRDLLAAKRDSDRALSTLSQKGVQVLKGRLAAAGLSL